MPETTAYRICPLCEATCGLELTITDGRVTGARGDRADVFSHGFICPTCCGPCPVGSSCARRPSPRTSHACATGLAAWRAGLVLVGRRHLRSNNSWMHNLPGLVRGTNRCTLQVHPDDAGRLGLADADTAEVRSQNGAVEVEVEVTEEVMPGVVSLPHGWGHGAPGTRMSVAAAHAGVNANALTDPHALDPLSGNAVLTGIAVRVRPA